MQQPRQININPAELETIACDNCGGIFFQQGIVLKKLPALVSPTGREEEYPMPILICGTCGKPRVPGAPKEENKVESSLIV